MLQLNSGHCCQEYPSKSCSLRTDRAWEVSVLELQVTHGLSNLSVGGTRAVWWVRDANTNMNTLMTGV